MELLLDLTLGCGAIVFCLLIANPGHLSFICSKKFPNTKLFFGIPKFMYRTWVLVSGGSVSGCASWCCRHASTMGRSRREHMHLILAPFYNIFYRPKYMTDGMGTYRKYYICVPRALTRMWPLHLTFNTQSRNKSGFWHAMTSMFYINFVLTQ